MIRYDTKRCTESSKPYKYMSSNIRVVKICEMCSTDFIAKKTTSKTCSDNCAKRLYKLNKRNEKIAEIDLQTVIKKRPKCLVTEEEIRILNSKMLLTLNEAALLLNISPLTLRRWTLCGKMPASKIGKKWVFKRKNIEAITI